MPNPPQRHFTGTVWTAQGVASGALVVALAVRHRGDNLDGAFDHMLDLGQSSLDHRSELGKALGGLHPIIADPLKAFGHNMLHHPANEPVDIDGFVLNPFGSMGSVMIGDAAAIIAIDAPH
jgi:hypothetical protein